jgi:HlyD family secretion protein
MNIRGRLGWIVLAAGVVGGLLWGFWPGAVRVDLATVAKANMVVTVVEEGKTRVRDRYVVVAPVDGYLQRISWKAGDEVTASSVVAVIEPTPSSALDTRTRAQAQARVQAAQAAWAAATQNAQAAEAQALLARQEWMRAQELQRAQFVSPQVLDKAKSDMARADALRLAADHGTRVAGFELEMAKAVLSSAVGMGQPGQRDVVRVRSPIQAKVLRLLQQSEGPVRAGHPLLEIGDPTSLEVEVEVLSAQAVSIQNGTPVVLDRWGGEKTLSGTVRLVEPAGFTKVSALGVEEQRVRVMVDFNAPPGQGQQLGDGYRVEVKFLVWQGQDVLQVPTQALFRDQERWAVFVNDQGRARLHTVQVGQRSGLQTQVMSGLEAGVQVIVQPSPQVREGVRVQAR